MRYNAALIVVVTIFCLDLMASSIVNAIFVPIYHSYSSPVQQPSTSSASDSIPASDPAAAPDGSMTACQKQQYWFKRAYQYTASVDASYDALQAVYYQKECRL